MLAHRHTALRTPVLDPGTRTRVRAHSQHLGWLPGSRTVAFCSGVRPREEGLLWAVRMPALWPAL